MAFGDWFTASNVGSAIKVGAGLYDMFRSHSNKSADQMSALLGASVNPDDPRFKNLVALFEEANRASAIKNIQDIINQDARSRARGGSGMIVNPERRDEFRANALNQAFMDAGQKARMEASGALSGAASGYAPLMPYDQAADQRKSKYIQSIGNMAGDAITGMFSGYQPSSFSPAQQGAMDTDYFDFYSDMK